MKHIIIFLSLLFIPVANVNAETTETKQVQSSVEISGTYTYSTDNTGSTHTLESDCYFKKTAMTIGITMNKLSDGMYYEWNLQNADGTPDFQPQANTNICYIGLNGDTNILTFSVKIRNSGGNIVNVRYFTFRFNENY